MVNPITGQTDKLTTALADPVEMGLLHMITDDPARTPTFTMFGDPDYFFSSFGSNNPVVDPGFAWNHGGIQPEIAQTWLGLVGPGVLQGSTRTDDGLGIVFSDHTDIRPTIMALLGLEDDYVHDGRVLFEALSPATLPHSLTTHYGTLLSLARLYKQINAPFGQLGRDSLVVSTTALESNATNDQAYTNLENQIVGWHQRRDAWANDGVAGRCCLQRPADWSAPGATTDSSGTSLAGRSQLLCTGHTLLRTAMTECPHLQEAARRCGRFFRRPICL